MFNNDTSQRFIFDDENVRGEIIHLDSTYTTIIEQRAYPKAVQKLLGEALLACVLITGSLKFEGEIGLQFHGDERLPLLVVQCDNELRVRAVAKFKEPDGKVDYNAAFLAGKLVLNVHKHKNAKTYQSIVPLTAGSLADNIMQYFAQSEQISTQLYMAVDDEHAAGMLLQLMPGYGSEDREHFWEYAVKIAETITPKELFTLDNQDVLFRLYHEANVRLFDPRPVSFNCNCDINKMRQALKMFGEKEAREVIDEKGVITVNCDFCNRVYAFDEIDLTMIFRE